MADLIQIAKNSNITVFTKAWCDEQTPKLNPSTLTPAQSQTVLSTYNSYRLNSTTSNTTSTSNSPVEGVFSAITKMADTQNPEGYMKSFRNSTVDAKDIMGSLVTQTGQLRQPMEIFSELMKGIGSQLTQYMDEQANLLVITNEKIGLTGQFSKDFRSELSEANVPLMRLGIGFDELASSAGSLISTSGRFLTLNAETWGKAGMAAKAFVGSLQELTEMLPDYEKVGLGASDATREITKAGKGSLEVGLQSQKTTKEMAANLGKLNEYGFKNGVQGLAEMVKKSTEFRMNMSEVFKIADKVMNPEGALELSANLQVLGGAIGDFNDPLKLMYMATNNVEGLQDALIGAAGNLATYNQEQGRFELTGVNLRKAKEMASQLGISYTELANGAIAAAERTSAASELMARGLRLDDKEKEFITNIAQMKDGKMQIELNSQRLKDALGVDSTSIALENLTETQASTLLKYQEEFKKMDDKEIVKQQATDIQNIGRSVNSLLALARLKAGKLGEDLLKEIDKKTGVSMNSISTKASELADNAKKIMNEGDQVIRKGINGELNTTLPTKGKVNKISSNSVDNKSNKNINNDNNNNNNQNGNNVTRTVVDVQLSAKGDALKNYDMDNRRSFTFVSNPQ
jgi:hypothetical protein